VTLCAALLVTDACTIIAIGKKATADGSALLAHTDDAGLGDTSDVRLTYVPAMDHDKGAKRPVYKFQGGYPRLVSHSRGPHYAPQHNQDVFRPLGHIPQVAHTYGYYDQNYALVNEVGLSVAESTTAAKTVGWGVDKPFGRCLFDIRELTKVGLERCATARCAVQTMGDLAVKYGFYSPFTGLPEDPYYDDSAEALGVADSSGEIWIFHVMTGPKNSSAVWAAQRVPDDAVLAAPNTFVIREIDFNDKANFMYSHNVKTFAQDMGWWSPADGAFDFTKVYTDPEPIPYVPLYDGRRMWRIYDLVAPSLKLDANIGYLIRPDRPIYPFTVKPDKPVTLQQVTSILRDHYEGTPFDLTQGLAAGPFNSPVRFDGSAPVRGSWERPLAVQRCQYSFVTQIRPHQPDHLAAVMWYGLDATHGTVYVPFYGGQRTVPHSYLTGKMTEFSPNSAFWAFNFVNNWCLPMWSHTRKDVVAEQHRLEKAGMVFVEKTDTKIHKMGRHDALHYIERHQSAFAESVVAQWWDLAWKLVAKYNNGYIVAGEKEGQMAMPGYPLWFLKAADFDKWPGDTFLYPPSGADTTPAARPSSLPAPVTADSDTPASRGGSVWLVVMGAGLGIAGTLAAVAFGKRGQYTALA